MPEMIEPSKHPCPNYFSCTRRMMPMSTPTENQVGERIADALFSQFGHRPRGCHPDECPDHPSRNYHGNNDR